MPRLTPINPLKSEKQEQNMNMVEMVTLNAYYVCEQCMENVEFSQFKNFKCLMKLKLNFSNLCLPEGMILNLEVHCPWKQNACFITYYFIYILKVYAMLHKSIGTFFNSGLNMPSLHLFN